MSAKDFNRRFPPVVAWVICPFLMELSIKASTASCSIRFSLRQIILAAVLDIAGRGTEAATAGFIFGLNGIIGGASPFIATLIINHLGGFGSIYYYAGILTAMSGLIVLVTPMARPPRERLRTG